MLLANKAAEKKSKKIAALVLGEEPTKAWGENDVKTRCDQFLLTPWASQVLTRHSTIGRAYTELINSFSESARDHVNYADGLEAQVVNALKLTEKGHDEAKKKVRAFSKTTLSGPNVGSPSQQVKAFQKLLSDRDRAYGDRIKVNRDSLSRLRAFRMPNTTSFYQSKQMVPCRSFGHRGESLTHII